MCEREREERRKGGEKLIKYEPIKRISLVFFSSLDPFDALTRGQRSRVMIVLIDYHHYRNGELERFGNGSKSLRKVRSNATSLFIILLFLIIGVEQKIDQYHSKLTLALMSKAKPPPDVKSH